MKNLRWLLLLTALIPALALAQNEGATRFAENSYVMRTHKTLELDDLVSACAFAMPFLAGGDIGGGERRNLYAIETNPDTGKVINDQAEPLGKITLCWGPQGVGAEGPGASMTDTPVVLVFNIGDVDYFGTGMARVRTPDGFLESESSEGDSLSLVSIGATVWRFQEDGSVAVAGAMTMNQLYNPTAVRDYSVGALVNLRVFSDQYDADEDALVDALLKAGLL